MASWITDTQLDGFEQRALPLPHAATFQGEPSDIEATIVRRGPAQRRRAVLYLHGWSDYFFQTHLADAWEADDFDFYALDLRRYGRSLRTGQLAGYVADLGEYYDELDQAVAILRAEGYDSIVMSGHSTGGLVMSLWVADHPGSIDGLVLNSPWLDMHHSSWFRSAVATLAQAMHTISPTAAIPVSDPGHYRRSIHKEAGGDWEYNVNLKGDPGFVIRGGWLKAILAGQDRITNGLGIDVPVFVALSAKSVLSAKWKDDMTSADVVLDVERLSAKALHLGDVVTVVRIHGGLHDLALSSGGPRARYLAEVSRWLRAYIRD